MARMDELEGEEERKLALLLLPLRTLFTQEDGKLEWEGEWLSWFGLGIYAFGIGDWDWEWDWDWDWDGGASCCLCCSVLSSLFEDPIDSFRFIPLSDCDEHYSLLPTSEPISLESYSIVDWRDIDRRRLTFGLNGTRSEMRKSWGIWVSLSFV